MLPSENYVYQIYNNETGKWEEIPYENVSNKDKLYEYFNIDTFVSNMNRLYTVDGLHLSKFGYKVVTKELLKYIEEE